MRFPRLNNRLLKTLIIAPALLCGTTGCHRTGDTSLVPPSEPTQSGADSRAAASATATPTPAVDLSQSQLNTLTISPVGTYPFPVEREAVGSVSFAEEPSIVQDESTLLGASATLVLTTKELARARDLYASGSAVAQRELEQAISDEQTADGAFKAARAAVKADGKTDTEIDQMIASGSIDLAENAANPTKWVLANVSENDCPLLRLGQQVSVTVGAYADRVFQGKISRIYATVDPNTHRMAVRCQVNDGGGELRAGMLARVVIGIQEPVNATAVPEDAVVREGDGTMTAWVTSDRHHFTQTVVQIGMLKDGRYQILKGLEPGELAVTKGAVFLSNMLVAPVDD